jgi:hypothetical protein
MTGTGLNRQLQVPRTLAMLTFLAPDHPGRHRGSAAISTALESQDAIAVQVIS